MKKPRPFSHSPIYATERKTRLAEIEQRARRELGLDDGQPSQPEQLRGVFASVQRHHKGSGLRWETPKLALLIAVLIVILTALL